MTDMINLYQLIRLTIAHAKEIIRQPAVLFWGIVFPILMALGLGVAFTQKSEIVRNVALVVPAPRQAASGAAESPFGSFIQQHAEKIGTAPRQYRLSVKNSRLGRTTFIFTRTSWKEAIKGLKRGSTSLVIKEEDHKDRFYFDPKNPDAQITYLKLANLMAGTEVPEKRRLQQESIVPLTVTGTRYIDFLVPGLISLDIMMSCMWGISYGMIERRSKKLLRRMVATPMKKSHFLAALITVRVAMNFIEAVLLFLVAWMVFGIIIQGSPGALMVIFLAGNIAFGGIAIFVSSRTANTEIGNGILNAVVLPMTVLSGVFFSYHNFPDWSIPFIRCLPLTLLTDGIRGIFIEGAGYAKIYIPALVLLAMGVFFFSLGLKIFKWH